MCNPAFAVISESKRFPIVCRGIQLSMPTWDALLPETRHPTEVPWSSDDEWVLKSSMCNTGDSVKIRSQMPRHEWLRARIQAALQSQTWIAQRRFLSAPVSTPFGSRHVCVGVYTVNGRAVGAYARLAENPLINFAAVDVALLLEDDE